MGAEPAAWPARTGGWTSRSVVLMLLALATVWALWLLAREPGDLRFTRGGLAIATAFLSRGLTPALTYESEVPPGTVPLIWKALSAARTTVSFAAAWFIDSRPKCFANSLTNVRPGEATRASARVHHYRR